jgi:hypothetical protein
MKEDSIFVIIMDINLLFSFVLYLLTTNLYHIALTELKMKTELNPVWLAKW